MKKFLSLIMVVLLISSLLASCKVSSEIDMSGEVMPDDEVVSQDQLAEGNIRVSLIIDCEKALSQSEVIPEGMLNNGVIISGKPYDIAENSSVYDLLKRAATDENMPIDTQSTSFNGEAYIYINGISGLYNGDITDTSGWVYYVNGQSPEVACDKYILKNGDTVKWEFIASSAEYEDSDVSSFPENSGEIIPDDDGAVG